jgi:membrane protease YdiL (CAAX protease family)
VVDTDAYATSARGVAFLLLVSKMQKAEKSRPSSVHQANAEKSQDGLQVRTRDTASFLRTLIEASLVAVVGAIMIAPFAAIALAAVGFSFPFPRIFDRVMMVTLLAALLLFGHRLRLLEFLRQGFRTNQADVWQVLNGLVLAAVAVSILFALASLAGGNVRAADIFPSVLRYLPAAMLIALIEEGFFRAFLLAGMESEFGSFAGLLASSAIFALVHVIRSPARFYVVHFDPLAGAKTLVAYGERILQIGAGPALVGFFLLGLVLSESFVLTRRVHCSVGMHLGFVLGAKTWRQAVGGAVPRWLAGDGPVPLVAAPATWGVSGVVLILLSLWLPRSGTTRLFKHWPKFRACLYVKQKARNRA